MRGGGRVWGGRGRLKDGAARSGPARVPGRSSAGGGAARRRRPRPRFESKGAESELLLELAVRCRIAIRNVAHSQWALGAEADKLTFSPNATDLRLRRLCRRRSPAPAAARPPPPRGRDGWARCGGAAAASRVRARRCAPTASGGAVCTVVAQAWLGLLRVFVSIGSPGSARGSPPRRRGRQGRWRRVPGARGGDGVDDLRAASERPFLRAPSDGTLLCDE